MRRGRTSLLWLPVLALGLLVLLGISAGTAAAQSAGSSVSWPRYDVDLSLQTDGSLVVTETQTVAFAGTFQHGSQTISLDRTSGISDDVSVGLVQGGQTVPLQATTSTTSSGLEVAWSFPPVTNASRTFVLRYTAHDVTRVYPNGDQVNWNAVYADRPGPVEAGTITLHLPADAPADALQSAAYLVPAGRTPSAAGSGSVLDGRTVQYRVPSLPAGTGFEVRAQFPPGVVGALSPPAWQAAADQADQIQQTMAPIASFLVLLLSAATVVGGGVALFLLWYTRAKEPDPGLVPPLLDTPPSDLPAPLVGTLVDGVANLRDAVSTLVDLAQRGVLSLTDEQADVRVQLHRPAEDPSLRRYERVLLVALFDQGATSGEVLLSRANVRFAAAVPILEQRLYEAVADEGLFVANPALVRRHYARLGWLLAGGGLVLAFGLSLLLGWLVGAAWLPGVALGFVGLALAWLSRAMPRRTPRGALEAARWRAFRAHLTAEPQTQEHLAYAVALGVDREFLRQLEQRTGAPPPAWYLPPSPGPVVFVPGGYYGGGYGGPVGGRAGGGGTLAPQGGLGGLAGLGQAGAGGPQGWSNALADLLNAASGALASGGGSGPWSGGGWGGGGGSGGGSGSWS